MKLLIALLYGLFACFQAKEALKSIGEPAEYQGLKLINEFNHYERK